MTKIGRWILHSDCPVIRQVPVKMSPLSGLIRSIAPVRQIKIYLWGGIGMFTD
jgi:hypothetical protein